MLRAAVMPAAARAAARLAAAFFAALRSAAPPAVPTAPVVAAPPAAAGAAAAAALFCALCPLGLLLVPAGCPLMASILRSMPNTRVSRCEAAAHMHTHTAEAAGGRNSGRQPGPYVSAAVAHCARPSQPQVLWSQTVDKGRHGTHQRQLPCSPLGATCALSTSPGSSPRP